MLAVDTADDDCLVSFIYSQNSATLKKPAWGSEVSVSIRAVPTDAINVHGLWGTPVVYFLDPKFNTGATTKLTPMAYDKGSAGKGQVKEEL